MAGFREEEDEAGSVVVAEEVVRVVEVAFLIVTSWTQRDSSSTLFAGTGTLFQQF